MNTFQKSAAVWNSLFMRVMKAPVLDKLLGRSLGVLTYTGRKSGKKINVPLAFERRGNVLRIGVMLPEQKNWWRNFRDGGARVDFAIGGTSHPGHAVTTTNDRGQVLVEITLDQVS